MEHTSSVGTGFSWSRDRVKILQYCGVLLSQEGKIPTYQKHDVDRMIGPEEEYQNK